MSLGGGDVERDEAEGEKEPGHGACFLLRGMARLAFCKPLWLPSDQCSGGGGWTDTLRGLLHSSGLAMLALAPEWKRR